LIPREPKWSGHPQSTHLQSLVSREQVLGLLVVHRGMDDDIVSLFPVDGSSDLVLVSELERVDHSEDLVEIAAGLSRVADCETDDLLGVDHKDGSDSEWNALAVHIGRIDSVEHVVEGGDLAIGIGDLNQASFRPVP
jgi:hypothetical protein